MVGYQFPELEVPVIIAMKGLPCIGKSEIARCIGWWARCPEYYIDHFLDTLSLERGYTAELLPSPDEAERLRRLAFDALCKATSDDLRRGYKCVVVKSRLCSTFELHRLVQLARERGCGMILIIELQTKNEHRARRRLEHKVTLSEQEEWYKPRIWNDIDKARGDNYDCLVAQDKSWEEHLLGLLDNGDETGGLPQVTKLVLDPFYNLYLEPDPYLSIQSQEIIIHLLCRLEVETDANNEDLLMLKDRYKVVQFGELGRYLREKELRDSAPIERKKYLCHTDEGSQCVFKYWEKLQVDANDEGNSISYCCGVCEELVELGQPAYTCYFCILTLHKSCAELPTVGVAIEGFEDTEFLRDYPNHRSERIPQRHACKSCEEEDQEFSPECKSCLIQTHLKCRMLPTILNHDCHEHFLVMSLISSHKCEACGTDHDYKGSYGCYICLMYYDIECVSLLREAEHEHSGHEHLLKLTYSRDGMEEEENYWCNICYEDMDPQNWFYSCQDCPYYAAHPQCVRLSEGKRITMNSSLSS